MQKIKSQARRHAWYDSNDSSENLRQFNIFGRVGAKGRKQRDPEHGAPLRKTASETNAPSPIETKRKSQYENEKKQLPPKSETQEGNASHWQHPKNREETEDSRDFVEEPEEISPAQKSSHFNGSDNTETTKVGSDSYVDDKVSEDSGTRQRKGVRKIFNIHHSENTGDDEGISRAETGQSTDSKGKKKKRFPHIPVMQQFKAVAYSWINIGLVFVPVGIALNYTNVNGILVFVMNFLAIIPLAAMLSFATEELALYVGETLGGLLNATFGNAVELIISIIALAQKKTTIVQTSLVGSMLSNLLLVLGMCFFFGGLKRREQFFNITVAQTAASLLSLAVGALIIPTAFRIFSPSDEGVAPTSRGTAVMLLVVYGCYLLFQLKTHIEMYNEPSQKAPKITSGHKDKGDTLAALATMGAGTGAAASGGQIHAEKLPQEEEEEEETPSLTLIGALITLAISTALVALCAEYMVSAIDSLTDSNVSEEFVGLILLPIVGNAAEHATAVTVAIKDKMDLAIGVAIGSSLQIALLVLPLMVIIGWIGLDPAMTLNFDGFQIVVLFVAIVLVNYLIQDGKSHWLEGVMLQITYLIIAVAAWFYPVTTS